MKQNAKYTDKDRQGIAVLVGAIVGHPVDCAVGDGSIIGGKLGSEVFQIMPGSEVEFKSPVKEFWWNSDYGETQQFWESPIDAGLHYARHYLDFVKATKAGSLGVTDEAH